MSINVTGRISLTSYSAVTSKATIYGVLLLRVKTYAIDGPAPRHGRTQTSDVSTPTVPHRPTVGDTYPGFPLYRGLFQNLVVMHVSSASGVS